ncbi:hypothetical protein JXB41_00810 [Candidatus Woesearchaeota archaeon]|nr:hypothetical protein [Candidatus Woesearchaeota archaeon]
MKIYGPVPSWRLGNSLGADIVEAPKSYCKICSFDCVYCQLGDTGLKTNKPEQYPVSEKELQILKNRIKATKPDYITFSGQGEPTFNLNLGYVAKRIKKMTKIPVAVLTNASFIKNDSVRQGLNQCDFVIAKIDAPSQELFEAINQPSPGIMLKDIIKSITKLKTKVAIQTLLFTYKNLTNADDKTIKQLIKIYKQINDVKPTTVFLGTAYRPTDLRGIISIKEQRLKEIAHKINYETGIEVIYYKKSEPLLIRRKPRPDELEREIITLLERRPCTEEEISTRFGKVNISLLLDELIKGNIIEKRRQNNRIYYFAKSRG